MTTAPKTALIVVDVQMAMFTYEGFKLHDEQGVLGRIVRLIGLARKAGTPVVFIQHTSQDEGDEFLEGSATWALHPDLGVAQDDIVVKKTVCDAFHETSLQAVLQELGATRLLIVGMQTDFCIDTTTRRAFSLGYDTVLIRDAHSTFDRGALTAEQIVAHHTSVLGSGFARLQAADEIAF
ncbi:cysteine hydrolase family protein [Cohnella sp. REN36]|uniref:cysteine hydrolase family protein n=1 Tax=Cohnella sp. REN36 TaxID=2887347 RepID=UPI001D14BC5B|nr:cysteine hydrolase family protein [Cohnella sp. REN36]MCC3375502.1 cysteine hydrolase [Cohnella sp. REN36]